MTHNVELTRRAEVDVDGILGWLRERSPQGAAAWYGVWCEVLDKLPKQPRCHVEYRAGLDPSYQLPVKTFVRGANNDTGGGRN